MTHDFKSKEFDDIYFSIDDGLAETKYIFIDSNHLTTRWDTFAEEIFRIGELGFGTGLNYFITLDEWSKQKNVPNLTFYSLERYPLIVSELIALPKLFPSLKVWGSELLLSYQNFLNQYSNHKDSQNHFTWETAHPTQNKKFILNLYIGDILSTLPLFETPIHAFYLDGFAPKKNPDMWSEEVFNCIDKLSLPGTTVATFTAAGFVKRNLEKIGFTVSKQKGYGRKREMLVGFHA
ncbi:MAG: tRNA (5-methylaminomethyl-2-thiouridine)(34)-methyltransferase MnmD [Leptospira sp.]|nr:tRNA (5-methylaminomethyl-2-thiouridine)(34)-methyltransferase MnmD [Leptospira sp.]